MTADLTRVGRVPVREARLKSVAALSPRVKNLRFEMADGRPLEFRPGQYVQALFPADPKPVRRSYSIASAPSVSASFDLCVTRVETGGVSERMHGLEPGQAVEVTGPLGGFGIAEPVEGNLVFVATGSGIAPLRSMIRHLLGTGCGRVLRLIFGNRFDDDILYKEEWESLAGAHSNFLFLHTLSRPGPGWKGPKGYVQEQIAGFVPDVLNQDFYICGLGEMVAQVRVKLAELGVLPERIHFERYS